MKLFYKHLFTSGRGVLRAITAGAACVTVFSRAGEYQVAALLK